MSPSNDDTFNYNNAMMNKLWDDMAAGFYNYGRIAADADLDAIPDLKQANEDMIEYIIEKLGICQDSNVLDLGAGKGMYTVGISKRTGCRFTGTDINLKYLEECTQLAEQQGISDRGEFVYSSWKNMADGIKNQKYTHILSLGSLLYGHPILDEILDDFADCCDASTKIFVWDFIRKVDWKDCDEPNKHLKMPHPLLSKDEVLKKIEDSRLRLTDFEDFTPYIIPGYKIMARECHKRDPEMKVLTYPLLGNAFMEGKLGYVIYYLELN